MMMMKAWEVKSNGTLVGSTTQLTSHWASFHLRRRGSRSDITIGETVAEDTLDLSRT